VTVNLRFEFKGRTARMALATLAVLRCFPVVLIWAAADIAFHTVKFAVHSAWLCVSTLMHAIAQTAVNVVWLVKRIFKENW